MPKKPKAEKKAKLISELDEQIARKKTRISELTQNLEAELNKVTEELEELELLKEGLGKV